ncbi:MAG: S8 family serine peptidase [Kiloniellaceae bacterium]
MAAARTSRVPCRLVSLLGGFAVAATMAAALLAPRAVEAQEAPKPVIVGIGITGCVDYGDSLKVRGRKLGRAGGRILVLRDPNVVVALPVSSWTDMAIRATVPKNKMLGRGKWYVLGIQETRSGKWLSGQGRPVQICEEKPAQAQPQAGANPGGANPNNPSSNNPGPNNPGPGRPDPREPLRPAGQADRLPPPAAPAAPGTAPGATPPPTPAAVDPDLVPDEVLAITGTLTDATTLAQQVANLGYAVRSLQELPTLGFALLRLGLPNGVDVPTALNALRQSFPTILFDANTLYEPDGTASQDGPAAGAPRHYAKNLVGWPEARPGCTATVDVGLIDTAVDAAHEALEGRAITARSFIAAGIPPAPPDHGTAVAALLVGAPDSNASGLLPAARLYAAAIFSVKPDNRVVGTTDAIARSIDWLGQQGVRVVNLSLSGPGNQVMRLTAERALDGGMVLVAAAGNEGPNAAPVFPAGYPAVLAVTAVDASLQPYRDANRGDYIDLAAPGVDVWSARGGQGGRYNTGTSFAAPFVSAAAALALTQSPDASPQRIRQTLQEVARDLGAPGRDSTFGWGLMQPPGGC